MAELDVTGADSPADPPAHPGSCRHPLFDPSSLYARMRAGGQAEYRIRGYMHWLRARADRLRLPLPRGSAASEGYRRMLGRRLASLGGPAGRDLEVLDAFSAEARILVVTAPQACQPCAERLELCLVREADGSHTLGVLLCLHSALLDGYAVPPGRYRCRLFLFEPEVVRRLEGLLGGRPYLDCLHPDVIATNADVARVLAAVSEWEGAWSTGEGEVCFPRLPVPDVYDLFPPRAEPLRVVAALHPAEDSPPPA